MSYGTVYRRSGGKVKRVGDPSGVRPGDLITFIRDGKFYSRLVDAVRGQQVLTQPLMAESRAKPLMPACLVPIDTFVEVLRPPVPEPVLEQSAELEQETAPEQAEETGTGVGLLDFLDIE